MKKIFTIVLLALELGFINNLNAMREENNTARSHANLVHGVIRLAQEGRIPTENHGLFGRKVFRVMLLSAVLFGPSVYAEYQLWAQDKILENKNKTWNLGKEIWPTAHEMSDDYLHNKEDFANRILQMAQMHLVQLKKDPQVKIFTTQYWLINFVELAKSDLERLKTSKSKLNFKPVLKKTLLIFLKQKIDDELAKIKLYKKRLMFILKVLLETEEYRVQLQRSYSDNSFVTVENV